MDVEFFTVKHGTPCTKYQRALEEAHNNYKFLENFNVSVANFRWIDGKTAIVRRYSIFGFIPRFIKVFDIAFDSGSSVPDLTYSYHPNAEMAQHKIRFSPSEATVSGKYIKDPYLADSVSQDTRISSFTTNYSYVSQNFIQSEFQLHS